MNGTPLPHEDPQELNPPSGVVAYYWLKSAATTPLKIELVDARGKTSVCVASDTPVKPIDTETINVQAIWEIQPPPPSTAAGSHRISLDIRPTRGFGGGGFGGGGQRGGPEPPSDACHPPSPATQAKNPPPNVPTQRRQRGAAGLQPGSYTVKLTVNGETYTQPVTVQPDPRNIPAGGESTAFSANNNQ
jgi:hypothetical protein